MALRIALAQINPTVGDFEGNLERVLHRVSEAAREGAGVVVFPELALAGHPLDHLPTRGSFQQAAERATTELADRLAAAGLGGTMVVVGNVGAASSATSRPTNRIIALHDGTVVGTYDKRVLGQGVTGDESRTFEPGTNATVIDVAGRRLGLIFATDLATDAATDYPQVGSHAPDDLDALIVVDASPYTQGVAQTRHAALMQWAAKVRAPAVYVNLVGGQDDHVFDGGSFVVGSDGEVLAQAPHLVEDLLVWDLAERGAAMLTGPIAPPLEPLAELYRAATLGLADYARKNGFRKVVLGLSGGIDSALVAAIAADALGGENIVGISMPSGFSSQHSKDDAEDLARRIGADYRVIPIGPAVEAFSAMVTLEGIAAENLQARVRGVIIMGVSNEEGLLALATGNRSELAVGYSTIYGDAVGGYAPLKDIEKSLVWALSRWRDDHAVDRDEIPPIPESSITKPASAELSPGQVDQDSLPPYDELDQVLEAALERGEGSTELIARGFDPAIVTRALGLLDRAEWKRRQYPLGPRLTTGALGIDRRLPATSRWREPEARTPTTSPEEA